MRVFLYEFVTGGGMFSLSPGELLPESFRREGAAMITALAADFGRLHSTEVITFLDRRLANFTMPCGVDVVEIGSAAEEAALLAANAKSADWTVLIAPEIDELLWHRARQVEKSDGRLLSPGSICIAAVQNKHTTLQQLAKDGIATPSGYLLRSGAPLPKRLRYPAIIKPLYGAGSTGIRWVKSADSLLHLPAGQCYRIEEFCRGVPVSVSVLCGPNGRLVLPPGYQHLANDQTFRYRGGRLPLSPSLRKRAEHLAIAVTDATKPDVGYVGIDMILAEHGAQRDVVVEVNPRLTTSYIGLRRLARGNLAAAMIDVAEGRTPDLSFSNEPVEFSADGTITSGKTALERTP